MASHAHTLDQPDSLSRPFWGSVFLHVATAALVLGFTFVGNRSPMQWGDPHGGGIGAVAITPVPTIKLPSKEGPPNPLANDTESHVPAPPPQKKAAEKVKAPDPKAIAIKNPKATKRSPERTQASAPSKFTEPDRPNQVTTSIGRQVSSPLFGTQGGGGLTLGNDSPFGTQFGAYAKLLRDRVASKWSTSDFDSRLTVPAAVVTFTIQRDGSVDSRSVKLKERSGNAALDISAQRAVLDAAPFSPLPPGFSKSEAQVELRFNLK
ncbi:MAG TPA: TonB family protein [Bryobacteraceae bacterium]|nr:TonB family protein [Bryobacteraceae bacterium]